MKARVREAAAGQLEHAFPVAFFREAHGGSCGVRPRWAPAMLKRDLGLDEAEAEALQHAHAGCVARRDLGEEERLVLSGGVAQCPAEERSVGAQRRAKREAVGL